MSAAPPAPGGPRRPAGRLTVGQLLGATIGVLLVVAVAGIGLALLASARLSHQRVLLLDSVAPSNRTAVELESALVNEETGIRGYIITLQPSFLAPYYDGGREETAAYHRLEAHERAVGAPVAAEVAAVRSAANAWRSGFASLALSGAGSHSKASDARGKALFSAIRAALSRLKSTLNAKNSQARSSLNSAAADLQALLVVAAVLILGSVLAAGLLLRAAVTRPLGALGRQAQGVAAGDYTTPLRDPGGPREVARVTAEMEAMREHVVQELRLLQEAQAQLREQALELSRSNADLEQFAYVASHDLQEPLRKITSFCQALQTRYAGQLDERADQYIEFAVDGAKRMQVLINDLLAFSRVGRGGREHAPVALGEVLAAAESSLSRALQETGGEVRAGELPTVLGDTTLLRSLLQNLIGNALRFHGAQRPVVHIAAERDGDFWQLSVADNGIGVEPEYAERIFLIFQRLHSRADYDGSGIGLALCRKIVEYHGGRIWLDTATSGGACFRFTLPAAEDRQ